MAYELGAGTLVTASPALKTANAAKARTQIGYRAWRRLAPDRRLEAVERALSAPANDLIDAYPVAL